MKFASYAAGAVRLSALSHLRVIWVATHDSVRFPVLFQKLLKKELELTCMTYLCSFRPSLHPYLPIPAVPLRRNRLSPPIFPLRRPKPHIDTNCFQIGLGEDGPTHQPIETVAHFRALPNCNVWRPAGKSSQLPSRPSKPPSRPSCFLRFTPHLFWYGGALTRCTNLANRRKRDLGCVLHGLDFDPHSVHPLVRFATHSSPPSYIVHSHAY